MDDPTRAALAALLTIAIIVSLSCCTSLGPTTAPAFIYEAIAIDPLECTKISLRKDVAIAARTIYEDSALPGQVMVVLQYVELPYDKGAPMDLARDYVNVYLVSSLNAADPGSMAVSYRYLVTDLWRFYPEKAVKLCLQWSIWEEKLGEAATKATLQVLVEDLEGRFIEEHTVPVDQRLQEELAVYYNRMRQEIQNKLEGGGTAFIRLDAPASCQPAGSAQSLAHGG
jgi:hypothetical protein